MDSNDFAQRFRDEKEQRIKDHQKATARTPVATRDDIILPGLGMHQRRQAEGDARVREARAGQFKDWFFRTKGRAASDAEVAEYLGDGPSAA